MQVSICQLQERHSAHRVPGMDTSSVIDCERILTNALSGQVPSQGVGIQHNSERVYFHRRRITNLVDKTDLLHT